MIAAQTSSKANQGDDSNSIHLCLFSKANDVTPRRIVATWDELVARLKKHDERTEKDGPLWSPAIYRDDATRSNAGVIAISTFVADIDHDGKERYDQIVGRLSEYDYAIYSTHSHTIMDMRFRVVVRLTQPVQANDWPEVWARVNYWLFDGALDQATKDISRAYYLPSRLPGAPKVAWGHKGRPLDPYTLGPAPQGLGANGPSRRSATVGEIIPHGVQHYTLVSLAGSMRRRGLSADAIEPSLQWVNANQCEIPGKPENIRKIAESVERYQPDDPIIGTIKFAIPNPEEEEEDAIPREEPKATVIDTSVPELPDWARIESDQAAYAGSWLDEYIAQSMAVSPMTPRIFHESAGLVIASAAIARRLSVSMAFGTIYPNIWTAWIAPTTLWHKTTALNYGRGVALRAFGHLLAPNEWTPESLLSDLSGAQPKNFEDFSQSAREDWIRERNFCAQKTMVQDEMSGLLASAGKDYNQGMVETLMQLYDCNPDYRRSTRGQGRLIILNSYLSFIGASTPRALAEHLLEERLWGMGWWPRFALLTPEEERPEWALPKEREEPDSIVKELTRLYSRLPMPVYPMPARALRVQTGEGVMEAWQNYSKALCYDLLTDDLDRKLWGSYGRIPVHTLKIATILAALDWESESVPRIEMAHLARAVQITESWRASAHRTLTQASQSEFTIFHSRVFRLISKAEPHGATLRDICRNLRDKRPDDIEPIVRQMIVAGDLETMGLVSTGGRPAERFRIARDQS